MELIDVFHRPKLARDYQFVPGRLSQLFAGLAAATVVELSPDIPMRVRDPKDEMILAAAIGGGADYLVTGDQDLLVHAGDPRLGKLQIVTAARFLAALEGSSSNAGSTS